MLGPVGLEAGHFGFDHGGEAGEQAQVGFDGVGDAGAANFDDDFGAVLELGAVDLRDGGGSQGFGVEAGEHGLGLAAEVFAQLGAQAVERYSRGVALQLFKFGDVVGAEQVGATGQNLAQFDEGRAEFFQG